MLTAAAAGKPEHRRALALGAEVWLGLRGPRRCIGVWSALDRRRVPCPAEAAIPPGVSTQCADCAGRDRGRRIARDQAIDSREFVLYVAGFGPGLFKVGITAADRGRDRLLEQGAPVFAVLARGRLASIRAAERAISAAGLASERISHKAKSAAWWNLPEDRIEQLLEVIDAIRTRATLPPGLALIAELEVTDQTVELGLDGGWPDVYREVTGVGDGSVIGGRVAGVPGRHLLLAPATGPTILVDARHLAGWPTARPVTKTITNVATIERSRTAESPHDDQDTLF